MSDGVWRVDVEIARDPVTGRRRRVSRTIQGTREDAELALARLRVADHEKRLPTGGTNARSVAAVFQLYRQAIDAGLIELAPSTIATVRSASKIMASVQLPDGREFGSIRLSRLTWQDIEYLYGAMRAAGKSPTYVRRCATATVLARALDLARKRGLLASPRPARRACSSPVARDPASATGATSSLTAPSWTPNPRCCGGSIPARLPPSTHPSCRSISKRHGTPPWEQS